MELEVHELIVKINELFMKAPDQPPKLSGLPKPNINWTKEN